MATSEFLRNLAVTGSHLAAHPREWRRVPRWLHERKVTTLELRQPWWPYDMTDFVEAALPRNAKVFEYGGGGSSLWLCDHGVRLTVVEHHPAWSRELRNLLPNNVELIEAPPQHVGRIVSSVEDGHFDDYVQAIDNYPDNSFDLVIVDGRARGDCVVRARDKVRSGGYLLLDDSDRPRYQAARRAMSSWPAKSIRGLKIGSPVPATTTLWTSV